MTDILTSSLRDATDTKVVVLRDDAIDDITDVLGDAFPGRPAVVVGDGRTMEVAGHRVHALLGAAGVTTLDPVVLPATPELYAQYENVETIRDRLAGTDAVPVAVGSGTLNDLVKRAASELGRQYMIVATAASMDGYTAFGASIAVDGFKQTLECPAPRACVADTAVMAAAPESMTASGYGDLLGKVPAGADWIVADALGVEPIEPAVWQKVQERLHQALARPDALRAGDPSAVRELAEGLLMSGLAMQAHASSRPASGAEHQFSHLWEMEGHGVDVEPRRLPHGFKVGVGSVAMAALYEELLATDLSALDVEAAVANWRDRDELEAHVRALNPNPEFVEESVQQSLAKWIPADALRERLTTLTRQWEPLRERLQAQLLPATELQDRLRAVGAPAHPADIGLDWARFRQTYFRAQTIRKRYTVLDTLFEAGMLTELVDRLFSPDGFWGRQAP